MDLLLASAVGVAPTGLAAFDDALLRVGAANYNLVRLSSVIPPGATLVEYDGAIPTPGGMWGDRLYVVYAEQRASVPGESAWAGIGWVQDPLTGRGLFVEHEGTDEEVVRLDIVASLHQMQAARDLDLGEIHLRLAGATCAAEPLCALVLCAYATEQWAVPEPLLDQDERILEALAW